MVTVAESFNKANTFYIFRENGVEIEVNITGGKIQVIPFQKLKGSEQEYFSKLLKRRKVFNN